MRHRLAKEPITEDIPEIREHLEAAARFEDKNQWLFAAEKYAEAAEFIEDYPENVSVRSRLCIRAASMYDLAGQSRFAARHYEAVAQLQAAQCQYESQAELLQRAARCYQLAGEFQRSASCFFCAAVAMQKLESGRITSNEFEIISGSFRSGYGVAALLFVQASKAYIKADMRFATRKCNWYAGLAYRRNRSHTAAFTHLHEAILICIREDKVQTLEELNDILQIDEGTRAAGISPLDIIFEELAESTRDVQRRRAEVYSAQWAETQIREDKLRFLKLYTDEFGSIGNVSLARYCSEQAAQIEAEIAAETDPEMKGGKRPPTFDEAWKKLTKALKTDSSKKLSADKARHLLMTALSLKTFTYASLRSNTTVVTISHVVALRFCKLAMASGIIGEPTKEGRSNKFSVIYRRRPKSPNCRVRTPKA